MRAHPDTPEFVAPVTLTVVGDERRPLFWPGQTMELDGERLTVQRAEWDDEYGLVRLEVVR